MQNETDMIVSLLVEVLSRFPSHTRRDEQNPKIVSKSKDFGFSAKFLSKLSFCKNRGDFLLTQ